MPKPTRLPASLAKNAAKVSAKALRDMVARGREDVALILERKKEIASAFYDIGEALVRLKKKGVAEALGFASYKLLCERGLGLSLTQAESLVDIVTHVKRSDATTMGQTKAAAFAKLAAATPAKDTAAGLYARGFTTAAGAKIDRRASARVVRDAAKELRQAARGAKRGRGRTTSPEERALAKRIQAKLHRAGVASARVTAVATLPGREANLRIEGVPIGARAALANALRG